MSVISWEWIRDDRGGENVRRPPAVGAHLSAKRPGDVRQPVGRSDRHRRELQLPAAGHGLRQRSLRVVRKVTFDQHRDKKAVWTVTVHASSEYPVTQNPHDEPFIAEWGTEAYRRIFMYDQAGHGILNSAGDYYDPAVEEDDDRLLVSVQKNLSAIPIWLLSYRRSCNTAAWTVDRRPRCPPARRGSATCGSRAGRSATASGFRVFSYACHLSDEPWDRKILDAGFRSKDVLDANGQPTEILINGMRPTTPVLLDGQGKRLQNPSPTTAVYNTHVLLKTLDYSVLPVS